MEFRLLYRGRLPSQSGSNSRVREKHEIRKAFHLQLQELWKQSPILKWQVEKNVMRYWTPDNLVSHPGPHVRQLRYMPEGKPYVQLVASDYERCGFRFCPLILKEYGTLCSISVLFLRRDVPGNFVKSGGDIDNRIKTLFDALKMPNSRNEMEEGAAPAQNEDPFFCLLEDDCLISDISVTTDRLLLPMEADESINDVYLEIHVKTKVIDQDAFLADIYA